MKTEEEIKIVMCARADKEGLEYEVLEVYTHLREQGVEPDRAAFEALYEWDCL